MVSKKKGNNNKLSISLIKEEFFDFSQIVRDDVQNTFEIEDVGTVFYGISSQHNPIWIKDFFLNNETLLKYVKNSSSWVLLLIKVQISDMISRIFALSFGYGKYLLKEDVIEERFGLKTALNIISDNSIRSIGKIVISGNNKSSREQMPKQSTITDFGFDIDSDLIKDIAGKSIKDDFIDGIINGTDSFSCTVPINQNQIKEFLLSLYIEYLKQDYKTSFAWIDQVQPVRNKQTIETLDTLLFDSVIKSENKFWMAVPEVIDWESVKGFRIQNDKEIRNDILLENVLDSFKKDLNSIEQFKNKGIKIISSLNDEEIGNWSSYKCFFGETDYEERSYCINNGKWYEIDNDFVKKINDEYGKTGISNVDFIDNNGLKESDYNKLLTKSNDDNYICLDGNNVSYGGGHSKIEICDVLSKENQLIHIKQYGGSAVLSHLFNQAVVSAELIKSDPNFIEEANKKISQNEFKLSQDKIYDVIFGIISNDDKELPHIPFFSKITFCNATRRLKSMGFNPTIKRIKSI